MLTAGRIGTGRAMGEVCPRRCKVGGSRAAGAGQGGQDDEFAPAEAVALPFRLPVAPESGYVGVKRGRMGRLSGKCRINRLFMINCLLSTQIHAIVYFRDPGAAAIDKMNSYMRGRRYLVLPGSQKESFYALDVDWRKHWQLE